MSANEIIKGVWVGDMNAALDKKFLKKNKIGAVINCTRDVPTPFKGIEYLRLKMNDSLQQEDVVRMIHFLPYAVKFLEMNRHKNVLVHCHAGMQRSATIVTAYIANKYKVSVDDAINIVLKKRPVAFHHGKHLNFARALNYYSL